ncbi:unnamed protein product [Nippostrongylus brasiliensis]|uniref:G protein-coupled receptor n=1 Tax=Nippostrongylus brasiliensis TaxID=27835 RepID=A0A0N4Y6L6_NIPBR|nr:unnamed protein product [Nippostrongylus brasiliensis]
MKSYFIIYSTPTLGQPVMVNWIALIMLALSITATVVLLTYSFIYRYLQLCRSDYLEPFLIKKTIMSLALLGVVYPLNVWIFIIVVYSYDSQFVIDTQEVSSIVGVDINNAVIIGFSLKKSLNRMQTAVTIEIFLFTFIMFVISVICALNIASFLKKSTLSKTSLAHYRRMFLLLLVQTACPTFLMFLPLLVATIAIFGGVDTPLFYADCVDMAFSLAALLNPLIIIAFLGEYRNFILYKLGLNKRSFPLQAINLKVLPLQRHFRISSTQY